MTKNRSSFRRFLLWTFAFLSSLLMAVHAQEVIRVGVNFPRSGPIASLAPAAERGLALAVEEINSKGGVASLGGSKIELVYADNQGRPDLAISEQERLIQQENVVATIGSLTSATSLTATQVSEVYAHPHIVPVSTADELTERGMEYIFVVSVQSRIFAEVWIDFLTALRLTKGIDLRSVVVLHEDSDYGESIGKWVVKFAPENGFEIDAHLKYPAAVTDVSVLLTKIRGLEPDVVLQAGYVGDTSLIWNTKQQLRLNNIPFIGVSSGIGSPEFSEAVAPEVVEGSLVLALYDADFSLDAQKFDIAYRGRFGVPSDSLAASAYQAVWALKEALENASSTNSQAVRDALANLQLKHPVVLPQSILSFNKSGQNSNGRLVIMQFQDSDLVTIWPGDERLELADLTQFDVPGPD